MKSLELKARLLCEGANPEDRDTVEFLKSQNPQKVLRGGLSSGLKVKIVNQEESAKSSSIIQPFKREFIVNFPLYSKIPVALKIRVTENGLVILENGEEIGSAEILSPPDWYKESVDGYPITSILTQHNNQVMGSVYEWCSLFNTGEQCKFCVIDKSQKNKDLRSVKRKSELILQALEKIPREAYRGLGFNGGMTFSESRGLEQMIPLIKQIRNRIGDIPIAVEMTPPLDLDCIDKFADSGGESLMMNLEIWDDQLREKFIPGKAKYCSKDSYFKAFERALEVLGEGKVSTCFVVGSESQESLKQGIKNVADYGVIPSPLAGRYFENIADYAFEAGVDWKEFLEIFRFTREQMAKNGLISSDSAGCIACGACDIIGDNY